MKNMSNIKEKKRSILELKYLTIGSSCTNGENGEQKIEWKKNSIEGF